MKTTYDKIESVLLEAGRSLAPHEFADIRMDGIIEQQNGREFVGQSESAIGRRLREMRELGRVTSSDRPGTAFKEYSLVKKAAPVEVAA